jgi:hypothetical protein
MLDLNTNQLLIFIFIIGTFSLKLKIQGVASPYIVSIFLATVLSTFKKKGIDRRLYSDNESDRKVK